MRKFSVVTLEHRPITIKDGREMPTDWWESLLVGMPCAGFWRNVATHRPPASSKS